VSVLALTPEAKQRAHELALYAADPAHWFRAGEHRWTPGDRPEYVAQFESFRAVFTFSVSQGSLWRHLSVSVNKRERLPIPMVVFTIASWFGFTGGVPFTGGAHAPAAEDLILERGEDWIVGIHKEPIPCIVLAQRIGPAPATTARAS
jgi:hypothetical protein